MLRVVLDANVLISSVLTRTGPPARLVDAWRTQQFLLILLPSIIEEVRRVLIQPRIRRKYPITDEEVTELIHLLEQEAFVVPGEADVAGSVPRDPDDEIVLACAVDGKADLIISGDGDLLELREYRGIPILSARQLLTTFERVAAGPS